MFLLNLLVCVTLFVQIHSARILTYIPTPSISHQVPFRPLTQELARRGHEVVVITTDPAFPKGESPANLTEIDVHDISYGSLIKFFQTLSTGKKSDLFNQMEAGIKVFNRVAYEQLNTSEVKEVIFGQKFDLLLLESCSLPILALSHVHNAPVIQIASFGMLPVSAHAIGASTHLTLYPTPLRQRLYNLTLWEKINVLYDHYRITKIMDKAKSIDDENLQKLFGKDIPPMTQLLNNIDMIFLNVHPIFEGNHPVPPGVIYIWGIHKKPHKELPQDLKTFLDSSKNGVIYMSFGTNTDPTLLPPEKMQKFVKVFCQLPYNVLLKWNNDELPGRCSNIKIGKWFPQSDLLRHPNVKAFVTQGGLQSTDEAITAGVPLVGIPMLGDQWYNVEKYAHFKIGVRLDMETFTEEQFKNAISTVIDDESYRQNIKKLNVLMRDEPMPALDRAVWWVEHVLRHGGARHLRSPAANITWSQYLELELVLILLSSLLASVIVIALLLFRVSKLFNSKIKVKLN